MYKLISVMSACLFRVIDMSQCVRMLVLCLSVMCGGRIQARNEKNNKSGMKLHGSHNAIRALSLLESVNMTLTVSLGSAVNDIK